MNQSDSNRATELIKGSVLAPDKTPIGFVRMGAGSSVVIVHGSMSTGNNWLKVAQLLQNDFTCYLIDRRGRGRSGDEASYAIEREYEDVEAILQMTGPDTYLVGHSFGAVCCLGAALNSPVAKLALYEPPLPVPGAIGQLLIEEYRTKLENGDIDGALTLMLTHILGLATKQLVRLQATPLWAQLVSLAPTFLREQTALDNLNLDSLLENYHTWLTMPTLLMSGGRSAQSLQQATTLLERILTHVKSIHWEGQGHNAIATDPQLVANTLKDFFS